MAMKNNFYLIRIMIPFLVMTLLQVHCTKDPLDTVRKKIPAEFQYLAGIFDGDGVGAGFTMGPVTVLFNQTGDKYAWIEDGVILSERGLNDSLSLFKKDVLGSVGAAIINFPKQLYLFDRTGSQYTVVELDARIAHAQWDNTNFFRFNAYTFTTHDWGKNDSCPFSTIGSIWYDKTDRICGPYLTDYGTFIMSNGTGNLMVNYQIATATFSEVKSINHYELFECGDQNAESNGILKHLLPLASIDAVVDYFGPDQALQGEIFFLMDGRQFGYQAFGTGMFMGPYDLY